VIISRWCAAWPGPAEEGARLLKACDLYVSPHSSHMVGQQFFGSPTKIFEYMAMPGGVVASDLEHRRGAVARAAAGGPCAAGPDRKISARSLCTPGNVGRIRRSRCRPSGDRHRREAGSKRPSCSRIIIPELTHVALWAFAVKQQQEGGHSEI